VGAVGWEQLISHELPSLSCVERAPSAAAALAMAMLREREREKWCVWVCASCIESAGDINAATREE
jgi:hypothetical protein